MGFGLTLTALWIVVLFVTLAALCVGNGRADVLGNRKYKLLLGLGGLTCVLLSYWMMWHAATMEHASNRMKVAAFVGGMFLIGAGLPQVICALLAHDESCRKFLRFLYKSSEANGQQ